MFRFLILIVPFILSSCENSEGEIKKLALSSIEDQLKDPDSAKFSDVFLLKKDKGAVSICGYVNAKNSFGGYIGKVRFVVRIYKNKENNKYTVYSSTLDDSVFLANKAGRNRSTIGTTEATIFELADWNISCVDESHPPTYSKKRRLAPL